MGSRVSDANIPVGKRDHAARLLQRHRRIALRRRRPPAANRAAVLEQRLAIGQAGGGGGGRVWREYRCGLAQSLRCRRRSCVVLLVFLLIGVSACGSTTLLTQLARSLREGGLVTPASQAP